MGHEVGAHKDSLSVREQGKVGGGGAGREGDALLFSHCWKSFSQTETTISDFRFLPGLPLPWPTTWQCVWGCAGGEPGRSETEQEEMSPLNVADLFLEAPGFHGKPFDTGTGTVLESQMNKGDVFHADGAF